MPIDQMIALGIYIISVIGLLTEIGVITWMIRQEC